MNKRLIIATIVIIAITIFLIVQTWQDYRSIKYEERIIDIDGEEYSVVIKDRQGTKEMLCLESPSNKRTIDIDGEEYNVVINEETQPIKINKVNDCFKSEKLKAISTFMGLMTIMIILGLFAIWTVHLFYQEDETESW